MSPGTGAGGKERLLDELEQEIGTLVRRIRGILVERARAVHEDLQPAAYLLLANVADSGPKRSSDAVEELGIDKGAVSRQVQQLCDLGLVLKTPDPEDGRALVLSVTDEGARRLHEMSVSRRKVFDQRLSAWSDGELGEFVGMLGRYNRSLEPES